ncbi:SMI1/KNR4 family protein [Streptacidiphilus jiangxiensis]|uniref:Cell wall assembly regulator SMI1 n=1 Tax=Streptacidiphilus jiangxiensis TaxID=235985 RepID=A0A1H7WF01_STRJI|nr:SMI1/KNR4 family protein [Streptacidiphilus jiangxiensis]SEM20071.1 Cell wall assembly regulator SMI1 [Streptacidiphilus jiangxiensis]
MASQVPDLLRPAWTRFSGWLAVNAPASHASLGRIAFAQEIASLESQLGFRLHPELKALLRLHNGTTGEGSAIFLPLHHRLIGTAEILQSHFALLDLGWHDENEDLPWGEDDLNGHIHQWVPFAVPLDGGYAFVDHRPGPSYGHVYEMGIGSGDCDGTLWATSLSSLFAQLADAVEGQAPFRRFAPRLVHDPDQGSTLTWDILPAR